MHMYRARNASSLENLVILSRETLLNISQANLKREFFPARPSNSLPVSQLIKKSTRNHHTMAQAAIFLVAGSLETRSTLVQQD